MRALVRAVLAFAVFAWAAISYLVVSLAEPFENIVGALSFVAWFGASVGFLVLLRWGVGMSRRRHTMQCVRFSVANLALATPGRTGLFNIARDARADLELSEADGGVLDDCMGWFRENLAEPPILMCGPRPEHSGRTVWFKANATEHIERARAMAEILTARGIVIRETWEPPQGTVVYEDEFQVVVEPKF